MAKRSRRKDVDSPPELEASSSESSAAVDVVDADMTDENVEPQPDEQPGEQARDEQPADDADAAELPADFAQRVEATLLGTDRPMPAGKIGELLGAPAKAVSQAVASLNKIYEDTQRSFRIEQVAGGWQILTLPQYAEVLSALHKSKTKSQLSPAALETLAIIAYKQPILRADIETIRGVASGEMVRTLMERGLVKIVGRAEEIGRPMLYGTTRMFLEVFGLSSIKDLPKVEELRGGA